MKKQIFATALMVGTLVGSVSAVELILNGDLEAWTSGAPDEWDTVTVDSSGNAGGTDTAAEETVDLRPGTAGTSCATGIGQGFTFRYWLHTNAFHSYDGNWNYDGWQKGDNCRSYAALSTDAGTTWTVDFGLTGSPSGYGGISAPTTWTNVTGSTTGAVTNGSTLYRISFHQFSATTCLVDDVSVDATAGVALPVELDTFTID